MTYFIGIDIGGTVTKAGLYQVNGEEVLVAEHNAHVLSPQAGFTERNMGELWHSVCQVVRQVVEQSKIDSANIKGVSFSSHGKGLYAIDKQGKPVRNGIISSDTRALSLVQQWQREGLDRKTYQRGLQQLWTGHPVALLHWIKQHEPENYQKISSILMVHDYVRFRFTDQIAAEITNISGSNLYNQTTQGYDSTLMADFDITEVADKVAPVISSTQLAGVVSQEAAILSGLKQGTPVYGGLFDVVASAICSGVTDHKILSTVGGTWSIATTVTDKIIPADYPYVWGGYCIAGKYFVHEGSPTSAGNLAWFLRQFMKGDESPQYDKFDQWVTERYAQPSELVFLPYIFGSNLSLNLTGSLIGMRSHHSMPDIIYAIYQGIVFSHMIHQDRILQLNPNIERIRMTGGPTHSEIWMQMFADAGNLPLDVVDIQQCGCRAAALCAAVGAGFYQDFQQAIEATQPKVRTFLPRPQQHQQLRKEMQRYLKVTNALSQVDLSAC